MGKTATVLIPKALQPLTHSQSYYRRHRGQVLAQTRGYALAHPEQTKARQRRWYLENHARLLAAAKARRESMTEQERERVRAWRRQWKHDNRVILAARLREFRKTESGKARTFIGNAKRRDRLTNFTRRMILSWLRQRAEEHGGRMVCHYCGTDCSQGYEIDHYIPLARGGRNETENLRVACPTCNVRKCAKLPGEFVPEVARA